MIDSLGNILWSKNYGGFSFSHTSFSDSYLQNSNTIYLTGETSEFGRGKRDVFVSRIDSSGNLKFFSVMGDTGDQSSNSMAFIPPDKLMIAGNSYVTPTQLNGTLIMTDTSGNLLRSRLYTAGVGSSEALVNLSVKPGQNSVLGCGYRYYNIFLMSCNGFGYSHCSKNTTPFQSQFVGSIFFTEHSESISFADDDTVLHPLHALPKTESFYSACSITTCAVNANFYADKYRLCNSDSLHLHNLSTDAANYYWSIDGNFATDEVSPVLALSGTGIHEVSLVAQDGTCYDTASVFITVDNTANANFSFTKDHQLVHFTNSDSTASSYHWDFGDGAKAFARNPSHGFELRQPYTVCLTFVNSCGVDSQCMNVDLSDTGYITFQTGQIWDAIGGQTVSGVIQTFDGGYIVTGEYWGGSNPKGNFERFDHNGKLKWSGFSGESATLRGASLVRSRYGGFFQFESGNGSHVTKYNDDLSQEWGMNLAGLYFNNVYEYDDGSYLFFGCYQDSLSLIKTDHFFRRLWQKKYGGVGYLCGSFHTYGGFVLAGRDDGTSYPTVYKIDESGNILWEKQYNGLSDFIPYQMTLLSDGGMMIAANYEAGSNYYPLVLFKIDSGGNLLWSKKYYRIGEKESIFGLCEEIQSTDFYVSLIGEVLKFDSSGSLLWNNSYSVTSERAYPTFDKGLVLGAHYTPLSGYADMALTKISKDGEAGCKKTHHNISTASVNLTTVDINDGSHDHLDNLTGTGVGFGYVSIHDTNFCYFTSQCPVIANFEDSMINNQIQFYDSSIYALTWHWEFGDGDSSLQQNPIHSYNSNGEFDVCLIAQGDCGSDTLCKQVSIFCFATASFGYTAQDAQVQFEDSSLLATSWHWDFGDGDSSSEQNPVHVYASNGNYTVCLIAVGICGNDTLCKQVSISCLSNADFSYTLMDNLVQFEDSSSLATSWYWDFDDGTTSTETNPEHLYSNPGVYNVCLTVSGPCNTDTSCKDITIVVTELSNTISDLPCLIFPNPVGELLTINCIGLRNESISIIITDLSGKELFRDDNSGEVNQFDLRGLSSGAYLVEFVNPENLIISTKKFVKGD